MSSERHNGQLFMAGFDGYEPSEGILDLIAHEELGGIVLFTRNLRDARQTLALTTALQVAAQGAGHRLPLLIAIDQENGIVRRLGHDATNFPGNMALGAAGDQQLVYDVALATGRELRALGINMNLAPVADVNSNAANPVIGVRSFGEDPQMVGRMVGAATRGYMAAGVVATLKHFPGHGDVSADSHLDLPVVDRSLDRLETVELPPFAAGIAADVPAVMTAHIALPALHDGEIIPSTLSSVVLKGLLRERLGFGGMIITDCLEMRAIAGLVGEPRGALLALQAGADHVLISHTLDRQRESLELVRAAARSGELSAETVNSAVEHVLALKRRFLSWETLPDEAGLVAVGSEAHHALSERAYARTTTLVRDRDRLLPLRVSAGQRVLVLARARAKVSEAVDLPYSHEHLVEGIRRRHANTVGLALAASELDTSALDAALAEADVVIVTTVNAHLDFAQAELVRRALATGKPVIGLALCDPYDLQAYPDLGTYLATYDYSEPALDAALAVIFGEKAAEGQLPVTLA
jgi:beta-N-acetylhexosaminidase